MDRNKQSLKRGPKVKTLPPPGDFIVLGSKASAKSEASEVKLGSGSHKTHSNSGSNGDRKRDASGSNSPSAPLSKKQKLGSTSSGSRDDGKKEREVVRPEMWDSIAIDVDPSNLVNLVLAAENGSDDEKIERMLCGAVKLLRSNRVKPESSLYLGLMLLAKTRPVLFCTDHVTEAFSSLLKRDSSINFKSKGNCLVPVLASNILLAAYQDDKNWPDIFIKLYLEDAFSDRIWVDNFYCKGFVDNVLTAFNTKLPPKKFSPPELTFKSDVAASPPSIEVDDDTTESMNSNEGKEAMEVPVYSRYSRSQESIDQYVMEMTRDHVTRRQPMDNVSWNVLRVLGSTCGLSEVRSLVAQRLEMWLQNPKLTKPAQDLLLNVCMNCNMHHQQDIEVISHLIKIRLKTKPIINHYLQCIRELINQNPDNLSTVLKHIIYNELSNSRNPNNMALLGVVFPHAPEQAAKTLAEVFQDVLNNREDYLRAVRVLFREIVRSLRHDLNFPAFCLGLMQERKESLFKDMEQSIRDRMFLAIADLITLSIFLSITPSVREAASANVRGDKRDIGVLRNFQKQVTEIQRDAVWWLHTLVPKAFKPAKTEFIHCLHKVLFMEQLEHYCNKDNWPQEAERNMFLRLASEVPVLEDTLMRILIIGLSKEHPLTASDALELVDQLVKRVASLFVEDFQGIEVHRTEFFEAVFNLCVYHYPENITLPAGYKPPELAIASLYWKAWIMLLIITAHNPSTFGILAWENFPTLRCFMEMCITNFPPPTMGDKADEMKVKELQICQLEKQEILEFENHLASASMNVVITESNSLLLTQLTMMDPRGVCRRPSSQTLEQLKVLNQSLKLGHLLCRSRNPDFLLDIIQRQGASQSMPWLADLVESSEGAFDMLPVQCLCEFLLNEEPDQPNIGSKLGQDDAKEETKAEKVERVKRREKERKHQQLLQHLRNVLYSNVMDPQATLEVLDYFLRRLSSQQSTARQQAARGLSLVLLPPSKVDEEDEDDVVPDDGDLGRGHAWLLKHMPLLPHFDSVRYQTSLALRQACLVEYDSTAISAYIQFLSEFAPIDLLQDLADLALDVAQMIIERTTIINYLLPAGSDCTSESNVMQAFMSIFVKYLRKAREPSKEAYSWSEAQDHILIQWSTGEAATMHIFVVQAMVVLLTYGPPAADSSVFDELLEIWFPTASSPPQAFLVDTSEEALLFPDWLKLRMMRSSVEVLVDAALKDLDPAQLVLFIQSFGLPIQSLSKLLLALDMAVEYNSYHVGQAVVDKDYMAKLIEVQRQRGAKHGERFSAFLGLGDEEPDEDSKDIVVLNLGMTSTRHRASPMVTVPPPAPLPSFSEKDTCAKLYLLFGPEMRTSSMRSERQNAIRSLQKHIAREAGITTMEKPFTREVISYFSKVFDAMEGPGLVHSLLRKHSLSCPLFRLLLSSCCKSGIISNPFASKLKDICSQIVAYSTGSKSPLIKVICENKQLGLNFTQSEIDQAILSSIDNLDSQTAIDQDSIIQVINDTMQKCPSHIEQVVQTLVRKAMQKNQSKNIISALTRILVDDVPSKFHDNIATNSLLVDWLELVEPEVINSVPELQQWLLFRRRQDDAGNGLTGNLIHRPSIYKTCRPYLLATLTHQANWETLQNCINFLLCSKDGDDALLARYTPAVVLDFLWACIYIPKIWQGRDKHVPKHNVEENVLGLSTPQVIQVAHYILNEASSFSKVPKINSEEGEKLGNNEATRFNPMETRLPLLLHCCNYQPTTLNHLVLHLVDLIESNHPQANVAHELLLHVYLQIPQTIMYIENVDRFFENAECTLNTPSKLDGISHTLLTALANTDTVRDWKEKMQDVDLACRKLASTHPILMLRQLPMIATALRGRVHFEFMVFRARHHLAFFTCIMGLLELLQPHLYKEEYGLAMEDVCESYFDLLKAHSFQNKELIGLITRFLNILLEFMAYDARRAIRYIQKHAHVLRDLSALYPDHSSLRSISSVISLPRHMPSFEGSSEEPAPLILSFALPQQPPAWTPALMAPIVARLANLDSVEDVMVALHELDMISNRKVACLEHFTEELKKLIIHPSESCRNLAHNLLMRLLKQKPSMAKDFLSAFLACLESRNYDIVLSALEKLAEFILLCQEHAGLLLQRVFHLNMTTNINTVPYVGEIIMLLNMLSGR